MRGAIAEPHLPGHILHHLTPPGSYTVQVVPPQGYTAEPPVTLELKMFDEVRVDFCLTAQ